MANYNPYQHLQQMSHDLMFLSNEVYRLKSMCDINRSDINQNRTDINHHIPKINTYDSRINNVYKRLNKLEYELKKKSKSENKSQMLPPFMPPPMLMFGGVNGPQQTNTQVNELIDSEDECDMSVDVYASDELMDVDEKIEIIDIKVNTLLDLISIGLKYKTEVDKEKNTIKNNTNDEDNTKEKNKYEDEEKNIIVFSSDRPDKNISFDKMIKEIVSHLNNKISNTIKPKDKKKDEKILYYEFCGKKYNINIQKIINLIEPLTKLNNLIGMAKIKESILDMIIYFIQSFENSTSNMLHTTIEGPPGVGKSKLGRILAQIYNALGVIESKRFVRVRRTDLIGKYLGHTAHKTQEVIDKAEGGVLFIDEAYSLGSGSDNDIYSKECIDTINMNLTEKKKNLIVIIAGYADELDRSFFSFNEGLKRRFPFRYQIEGYNAQEMTEIFYYMIRKLEWKLDKLVTKEYLELFFTLNKKDMVHYAGDIETIILECKITHARRVLGLPLNQHRILNKEDIENAFKKFITNKKNKNDMSKYYGMYS